LRLAAGAFSVARSILILFINARMAAGCLSSSVHFTRPICQQTPNLSSSQPQPRSLPPGTSLAQQALVSVRVSERTVNEKGFAQLARGASVEETHLPAVENRVHGDRRTNRPRPGPNLGGTQFIEAADVGENGNIEADSVFPVGVESEERRDLVCGCPG
jgi:hypothetical protein